MENIAVLFFLWLFEYGFVSLGVAASALWGIRQTSCVMLTLVYLFLKKEGYQIKEEQKIFGRAYQILSVKKKWSLRYPLYLTARHFIHYFLWLNVFRPAENGIRMCQQARVLMLSFKFRQDALEKVSATLDETMGDAKIWDLPSMYLIRWSIWYVVRGLTWCDKIDVLPNLVRLGQTLEEAATSAEKALDALEALQEPHRYSEITSPMAQAQRAKELEFQIQRVIFALSEIDRLRGLYQRNLRRQDRKEKQKLYALYREEDALKGREIPEWKLYLLRGQIRASNFKRSEIDTMALAYLLELKNLEEAWNSHESNL